MNNIVSLLNQSDKLSAELLPLLSLSTYNNSSRASISKTFCSVSFEHSESVRILIRTGNFTSALGVLRMQYETLVKALWTLYAASDNSIIKLQSDLTVESAKWADKIPPLSELLVELEGKAPKDALGPLNEFKEYSWKPLSSYIHGGIHAITRHDKGYPTILLSQTVKSSNALQLMTGMMLVVLSGDNSLRGRIPNIHQKFADCCSSVKPNSPIV